MESEFWQKKWEDNDIGFHQNEADRLLVKHFGALSLSQGQRIFLPLCGKTKDMGWLMSKGYRVVGCELNQMAVEELFAEMALTPNII